MVPDIFRTVGNVSMDVALAAVVNRSGKWMPADHRSSVGPSGESSLSGRRQVAGWSST